jgi:hypothetical protein
LVLRQIALNNYMTGTDDTATLSVFEANGLSSLAAEQEYTQIASQGVQSAIDAVNVDDQRTQAAETQLHNEEAQAQATLQQLSGARQAAQVALDRDNTLLSQTQGNLQSLLDAAARQRQEEQQAEEERMAAAQAAAKAAAQAAEQAAAQGGTVRPVNISINPAPGTYVNPLRAINALNPERIDQGVDYSGYGPIYALGDGTVLSTVNTGWPGDTYIAYRLTDGPATGLVVYAAEDIDPLVSVGQSVTPATAIGQMYEGPDGIETGWANMDGDGTTMANNAGQFSGANSTAFGANFSQLLESLGAPPGVMQNEPATGSLPPGWPSW